MAFYFNFAQASFLTENYEVTNFWIEKIKAVKPREIRPDIRVRTEFLKVLTTLSKKEFSKIDKVINASKRVVKKYKTVGSEELFILESLKKVTSNRLLNREILEEIKTKTDLFEKWEELVFWSEKNT